MTSPSGIHSGRTPSPTSCWEESWSPSPWSWYVVASLRGTFKGVKVHPDVWIFCAADRLWWMPVRPHVSRLQPATRNQVREVRLQGGGQLRVRRRRQPVSDGRGQILHRPSTAKLPGCLQTGVGTRQLRGWRVHGELHLHGGPFYGGRGQVTALKWKLISVRASCVNGCHLLFRVWHESPVFFRLSFFSGHASFAMYCMLFLAVSAGALRHKHAYHKLISMVWCRVFSCTSKPGWRQSGPDSSVPPSSSSWSPPPCMWVCPGCRTTNITGVTCWLVCCWGL